MGSATTQALAASSQALTAATGITLDSAGELFSAARLIGESSPLSGALADPSASGEARAALVARVFGGASAPVQDVLRVAVGERWSSAADLVDGIEELAVRAAAIAAPDSDVEGELFSVSRLVAANPELELALGSRLGDGAAKGALVHKLLGNDVSAATGLIVASLVRQPRERRVRQLLSRAMRIVSAQRDRIVATVHTAAPLSDAQSARLADVLSRRYGRRVALNVVLDPSVVGGLRVQVADDVIDGSISARLADLRHRLAG
ncbi:F0F1 ATP synthase subunit delta [Microbacterium resistens]|uniref:ATP synthase subunit delta n=1 Tax=Microbacterium resistens TaxID=156977 RepID=A0ABY3RYC0_9MICO|nr:F0F1 ATP synthase subunit delta [Microbacterium resistens]MBW1637735.1 F0F1 ATP synthase subunit delta [Microbacterium resistens]UGS27964.1 F0F1 ATP synthase subunit delta [Microbacterium resistens]